MTPRSIAPLTWCLLALTLGCAGPRLSSILVRDAETHAPVPGAEVRLSAPGAEQTAAVAAGPDGIAGVVVPRDGAAVLAQVTAAGYLPRDADLTDRFGRGEPAVVELFAGPRPTVELVLPDGFRGVVRARVRVGADAPGAGRKFSAVVPPSGVVEVAGPAVLAERPGPVFAARYESGGRLASDPADDSAVALRWVWSEGPEEVFVVGTRTDHTSVARELGYAPTTGSPRGRGGSPGNSGRGGRGGGQGGHRGGGR
ncbi:hypothetical protein J0H58_22240 [bacterium]|nr:hypothetical protein [bacterium]